MDRKITFAQYGCGKMGKYLIRYAIEKGASLVAAFDMNPALYGKDAAEIVGEGYPETGVKVLPAGEAEEALGALKPDVCIIATEKYGGGAGGHLYYLCKVWNQCDHDM